MWAHPLFFQTPLAAFNCNPLYCPSAHPWHKHSCRCICLVLTSSMSLMAASSSSDVSITSEGLTVTKVLLLLVLPSGSACLPASLGEGLLIKEGEGAPSVAESQKSRSCFWTFQSIDMLICTSKYQSTYVHLSTSLSVSMSSIASEANHILSHTRYFFLEGGGEIFLKVMFEVHFPIKKCQLNKKTKTKTICKLVYQTVYVVIYEYWTHIYFVNKS